MPPPPPESKTACYDVKDDDEDSDVEIEFSPRKSGAAVAPASVSLRSASHPASNGGESRLSRLPHRRSSGVPRSRVHRNNRASTGDSPYSSSPGKGQSSPKRDNNAQIKELLLSQFDLIRRQSDDIIEKDRLLRDLQRDNEKLKQRLKALELKNVEHEKKSKLRAPVKQTQATETDLRDCVDKDISVQQKKSEAKETAALAPKKGPATGQRSAAVGKKHKRRKGVAGVTAGQAYFVLQGEEFVRRECDEIRTILRGVEVPGWREKPVTPLSARSHCEEAVDDETYLKRHGKPELEEKRRKRWDMQRIREQRQIERLRVRYEQANASSVPSKAAPIAGPSPSGVGQQAAKGLGLGSAAAAAAASTGVPFDELVDCRAKGEACCAQGGLWCAVPPGASLASDPLGISHIVVADEEALPVAAFGQRIPDLATPPPPGAATGSRKRSSFSLNWMSSANSNAAASTTATKKAKLRTVS